MNTNLKKLHNLLKKQKLNSFLINNLTNIKYLSGFSGSLAFILITPSQNYFLTDARYLERCKQEIPPVFTLKEINGPLSNLIKPLLKPYKSLGIEASSLTYAQFLNLKEKLNPISLIPVDDIVERLREIKSPPEIEKIQKATRLNDQVFKYMKSLISSSVSLKASEIALRAEVYIKSRQAQGFSFDPIIAFSKDSHCPHAGLSKRKLQDNDSILIDFGTKLNDYHSDLTRVYFKTKYKGKLSEIYKIVKDAQTKAIEAVKPAVSAANIDKIARDYISTYGYGDYFNHSLGHGIGLDVHELPKISYTSKTELKEGMIFSVEPGIYLPNIGGVRLEDIVTVTKTGYRILSKTAK